MSHPLQPHLNSVANEEEDSNTAFLDLNDPNNEIIDERNMAGIDNEEESEPDECKASDTEIFQAMINAPEDKENVEEAANAVDLNDIPDREPARDDALYVFHSRDRRPLHAVAVHPHDTCLFATSGESDEVYVLRLAPDGSAVETTMVLQDDSDTISLLAFSPDGAWLASGSLGSVVALWSTETWELRHRLCDLNGEVLTLLWHPSSRVLLAGAEDAQAAMWNVAKGTLAMYFAGHSGPVTCMAWSPDYKKVLTGSSDGDVIIFNPKTGEHEAYIGKGLSADRAPVTTLCCLGKEDDRCVVGCADGGLHVISLQGGKAVASLPETHNQAIESLCISSGTNGDDHTASPVLLLSASCDCTIAVWNVANLTLRMVFNVGESVVPALWTRGHFIVAGCSDGEVKVWDGRSFQQEPLVTFMGHRRMIFNLVVCENTGIIATASDDGTARFFYLNFD